MVSRLTVRHKLFGVLVVLTLTGIVVGFFVQQALSPLNVAFDDYVDRTGERSVYVNTIQSEFGYGGAIHAFKNNVLRGQPKYVTRFEEAYKNINKALSGYQSLTDISAEERAAVAAIRAVLDAYKDGLDVNKRMVAAGATISAIDKAVKVNDSPAIAGIKVLAGRTNEQAAAAKLTFHDAVGTTAENVLAVLVGCLVLATVFVTLIAVAIIRPLDRLVDAFSELSGGEADLNRRLPVKGDDELAKISHGFNGFCEKVATTVAQVQSASGQISTAAGEMNQANGESQQAIEHQRDELAQAVTAMTELTASFREVAGHAAEAMESATVVKQDAEAGRIVVETSVDTVNAVAHEVDRVSQVISQLEKDSEGIGSVLDVIRGIAEQTNLLALNAAIEAARAGDQGRGFAVVADEVRTLAQRTQESTEEIQEMIHGLQSASGQAVAVMAQGQEKVRASEEEAGKVRETLEKIASGIETMRTRNTQIAHSVQEQSHVANEVDRNLNNVVVMMDQTSAGAANAASISAELKNLASQMDAQVSAYKT